MNAGKVIIISGPSGVGKTTIVQRLLQKCDLPLERSVSATTRIPRQGERHGINYHFLSEDEFLARRNKDEFLECCEVYQGGNWYGTLRAPVAASLAAGKWVILEIDVEGAMAVVERMPDAVTIFVRPASVEELERRLSKRGTEDRDKIQQRLDRAHHELSYADRYKYCVVNDEIDLTVQDICNILMQLT